MNRWQEKDFAAAAAEVQQDTERPVVVEEVSSTEAAVVPEAVVFDGPWMHGSSWARLGRAYALALDSVAPTRLADRGRGLNESAISEVYQRQVGRMRRVLSTAAPVVYRMAPLSNADYVYNSLVPLSARWSPEAEQAALGATVAIVCPETTHIDPLVADLLCRVRAVIVPHEIARQAVLDAGGPARTTHVCHPPPVPELVLVERRMRREEGGAVEIHVLDERSAMHLGQPYTPGEMPGPDRRYYAMGDWGPRDGLWSIIHGFLVTHKPGDKARLDVVANETQRWPHHPTIEEARRKMESICDWTPETLRRHVRIRDASDVSREDVLNMHAENNVVVCGQAWPDTSAAWFDGFVAGNAAVVPGALADSLDRYDIRNTVFMRDASLDPVSAPEPYDGSWFPVSATDVADALQRVEVPETRHVRYSRGLALHDVGRRMLEVAGVATEYRLP